MTSNFAFLKDRFPELAQLGALAEKYWVSDPNSCLIKLGMMGETIVNLMFSFDDIPLPAGDRNNAAARIQALRREGLLDEDTAGMLHILRQARNKAVHDNFSSVDASGQLLPKIYGICEWFMQTYGDYAYEHRPFRAPEEEPALPAMKPEEKKALREREDRETEKLRESTLKKAAETKPVKREARKRLALETLANQRPLTEAETRQLIDAQLRQVGWEADTENLRWSCGTRPQKGRNLAIAEWPCEGGYADYALFIGTALYAVIEAKADSKDVSGILDGQGRQYAETVRFEGGARQTGAWGDGGKYRVPFLFAANGRPYFAQYEMASGVWFRDLRGGEPPRALRGWISPEGILDKCGENIKKSSDALASLSRDFLTDRDGLSLRKYQVEAIEAAETAIAGGRKSVLLAMATGTGKTRTILGMIYRFLAAERFRRILFLVDRIALGDQAMDVFQSVKLEKLMPLTDIYDVKAIDEKEIGRETRVRLATVQSMIPQIFGTGEEKPSVTDYDLIIVDEAHRGYFGDQEMTALESVCRDQRDYQSKYRAVIDYFDAVKIGLTATPSIETAKIFGQPVYTYSYRDAVIDGYLADHDAPHIIKTKLSEEGIHYKRGDAAVIYDPVTHDVINAASLPDELDFDIEDFNKKVITEDFNRTVLEEIVRDIDPEDPMQGKTLIFAVNDRHADLIVKILKDYYTALGVPEEAVMKITHKTGNPRQVQDAVKRFKNERWPNIAVTVDLLSTGIDVPEITAVVFLRRVKSRILFEQMLGRATRLCQKIHKTHFDIYDAVGVYESLEDVITMPPAAGPEDTFKTLADQLEKAEKRADTIFLILRTAARLQRKAKAASAGDAAEFEEAAGEPPASFARRLRELPPEEARERILANREALEALDRVKERKRRLLVISDKPDEITEHVRGYGGSRTPEDYLRAFADYVTSHINEIPAMETVIRRPRDLTRADLIALKKKLAREGYDERALSTAVSQRANAEITADIISLIRRAALGSPLVSHEERIRRAVKKLKDAHRFTSMEENWLKRIEQYLIKDSVIRAETFDEDPRFSSAGGYQKINKAFSGRLGDILRELNTYLYEDHGRRA